MFAAHLLGICHLSCEVRWTPEWDFCLLLSLLYENKTFKTRSCNSFLKSETKSAFKMMFCEIKNSSCSIKPFHIIIATEIKTSAAQWIIWRNWKVCCTIWSINPAETLTENPDEPSSFRNCTVPTECSWCVLLLLHHGRSQLEVYDLTPCQLTKNFITNYSNTTYITRLKIA
jgi:hypothetical protein